MDSIIQGSPEWLKLRAGKVTASRIKDVMSKGRGGEPSKGRVKYMSQLITECITGNIEETFKSTDMDWGTSHEAQARHGYAFYTGQEVTEISFVNHPTIKRAGVSPDGLVGDDGLIEIKCPKEKTHVFTLIEAIKSQSVAREYNLQMQWQMACTERKWVDYISFDPRLPPEIRLISQRVNRDDDLIEKLETEVKAFVQEMDEMTDEIFTHYFRKEAS